MRTKHRMAKGVLALGFLWAVSTTLHAATYTFDGHSGIDSNWSTPTNWVGNVAPENDGSAVIVLGAGGINTSNVDIPWSAYTLTVATGAVYTLNGSTLRLQTGNTIIQETAKLYVNNTIQAWYNNGAATVQGNSYNATGTLIGGIGTIDTNVQLNTSGWPPNSNASRIAPGDPNSNNGIGTLTIKSLGASSNGANLDFIFSSQGNSNIAITNYLALGSGNNINITDIDGGVKPGIYPLISYSGAPIDAATLAGQRLNLPTGWVCKLKSNANVVFLAVDVGDVGTATPTWLVNGTGDWTTAGNWLGQGAPNAVDATALLTTPLSQAEYLTLRSNVTLGTLTFDSANAYTLVGNIKTSSLTMSVSTAAATISVNNGSHEISLPLHLASNTTFHVAQAADTLTLTGPVTVATGKTITKSGSGTVDIYSAQTYQTGAALNMTEGTVNFLANVGNGLTITQSGGTINLAASSHLASLTITGGSTVLATDAGALITDTLSVTNTGTLDLKNNGVIVKNGSLTDLTIALENGRITLTGGATLKTIGIISGSDYALLNGAAAVYNGVSLGSSDILLASTLAGDANMDGSITMDDYIQIDSGYLFNGNGWVKGDFNHDGVINADDYLLIDQNFAAQGNPQAQSLMALHALWFGPDYTNALATPVPEPASLALLTLGGISLLARRNKR